MSLENGIAEQLAKVTTLHANGALSDSEFSVVKSKIIGFENPKQKISQLNGIDAAYQAALERALPSKLEPTWERVMAVWWLMAWRSLVGGLLLSGMVYFIIRFIGQAFDESTTDNMAVMMVIISWVVAWAWNVAVVKMALQKKYSQFYLVLAPTDPR
jgi:hypothetical protein